MPAQHCIQGRADRRNIASAPLILNRSPDPAPTTTKSSRLDGFCHPLHHGQIAIAGTFRTSTPRGFLPWLPGRFRTTAPVPSRAVAMGRRPKPFTKAAVQAPRAESPPASQPDLRLAVVAVAPKSYFYPLQFKTSKKPRDRVGNEKHHCLPGPIRSKRAVLGASSAPRASDACVVFPDCRRECVKFDHRRSFAGKRSAGNPLVHRQREPRQVMSQPSSES